MPDNAKGYPDSACRDYKKGGENYLEVFCFKLQKSRKFFSIHQLEEIYREKKIQAIDNSVYVEDRLPILTQNVKADISLQVNIRMVNLD